MTKIELRNEQEEQAFLQVLDLATKAGGLNVAAAVATLHQRLVEAKQAEQKPPEPETD